MNPEDEITDWIGGECIYRDPDYVDGSHPMDSDDVTWHHRWQKPRKEEPPLDAS